VRISFAKKKLQAICNSGKSMQQAYGKDMAAKLAQRLADLRAATTLAEMSHLPPARCHLLTGNRKGQFSVDLVYPYRLIFKPDHDPVPLDKHGSIDRQAVTDIVIVEIADTH
jgi:proteic killer suppression protein